MTDHELATRLLAVVKPGGDDVFEDEIKAGEYVGAIIDLVEQAAIHRMAIPRELLDAVVAFVDDPALAGDDVAAVREDLATLAPLALTG